MIGVPSEKVCTPNVYRNSSAERNGAVVVSINCN